MTDPHDPGCMLCSRSDPAALAQHKFNCMTAAGTPWLAYSVEQLCEIIRSAIHTEKEPK